MSPERSEHCSWCGAEVDRDDGLRAYEIAGARAAVFCRLEHVVPWEMQGPHWEADRFEAGEEDSKGPALAPDARCSHCGEALTDTRVVLVRHRGEYRIGDGFCNADHLAIWAKSGGRWAPGT
jgi:hypothetical protein